MIKAVIFDWDGTLADSKKVIIMSFNKTLTEFGFTVNEDYIERLMGSSATKILEEIIVSLNVEVSKELIEKLSKKRVKVESELSNQIKLNKGAYDLLKVLKGKVKLALASMNNKEVIKKHLKTCKIEKFFDVVLSSDEVIEPKPSPDIFIKCAKELEVNVNECVVIEDSVVGIKGAKEAKMKCIAVLSGIISRNKIIQLNPNLIICSLAEKDKNLKIIFEK